MKSPSICSFVLFIFLGLPTVLSAQTTQAADDKEKPGKWHFSVNAGTHYLQSHYNSYYYYQNPKETHQDELDIMFRKSFGLWVGGNINYRLSKNWYLSSAVALHSVHSGYRVDYKQVHDITYREESSNFYLLTANPISATRVFDINHKWQIPVNLGVHLFFNIYGNYKFREQYAYNQPDRIRNDEYKRFKLVGGGLAPETGITRKLNKGELSLLITPTFRIFYFTGEYYTRDIRAANSGAILKAQYAFK